jgi:hypothetical protein
MSNSLGHVIYAFASVTARGFSLDALFGSLQGRSHTHVA